MDHYYLISYMDLPLGQMGAVEFTRPAPIRDMTDVAQVRRDLRNHIGSDTVEVTGFSKFEEPS